MTPIAKANRQVFQRYLSILRDCPPGDPSSLKSPAYLMAMCETVMDNPEMYDDKQSRWLGCVQGIMLAEGYLSLEDERNNTRGVFHEAYRELGLPVPDAIKVAPKPD